MSNDELKVGRPEITEKDKKVERTPQISNLSRSIIGLKKGATGQEVIDIQNYLRQLGYIQDESMVNEGEFDDATLEALEKYQRFYGLPTTGEVDSATFESLRNPHRCGVPDVIPKRLIGRQVGILANPWPKTNLGYFFQNIDTSPDIDTREKAAAAFQSGYSLWHAVTPIRFNHTTQDIPGNQADIVILWGIPGCGGAACTDWPYPGNSISRAYSLFDSRVIWVVNNPEGEYDIIAFAGHEVGHALGLYWVIDGDYYSHSPNSEALMYATIPGGRRRLHADDIAAARRVYG